MSRVFEFSGRLNPELETGEVENVGGMFGQYIVSHFRPTFVVEVFPKAGWVPQVDHFR